MAPFTTIYVVTIYDRMSSVVQMRIDSCKNLPIDHPFQPAFLKPLQTILSYEKFESKSTKVASDDPESTSSHLQQTNQT